MLANCGQDDRFSLKTQLWPKAETKANPSPHGADKLMQENRVSGPLSLPWKLYHLLTFLDVSVLN